MTDERRPRAAAFSWIGGRLCLDFTNTVSWHPAGLVRERLTTFNDLVAWVAEARVLEGREARMIANASRRNPARAAAALTEALYLREVMHTVLEGLARGRAPARRHLATLNAQMRAAAAAAAIAPVGGGALNFRVRWADTPGDLRQLLRPILTDAAALVLGSELHRLRTCANSNCGWLFVDRSRNRMRRWCSMDECGSRAKSRRYYVRHR